MGKKATPRHFFTKVVGVTHQNYDGTDRQAIIQRCRPFDQVELDHEENNPVDPNAVRVLRQNGEQIGYLRTELAEEIVSKSAKGFRYGATVTSVTGGTRNAPAKGVNLMIVVAPPGVTDQEVQAYVNTIDQSSFQLVEGEYVDDYSRGSGRHPVQTQQSGCTSLIVFLILITVIATWAIISY